MENYFWNTEETVHDKKVYVLIIYDIVNNSKRVKLSKKLEGYGFRVQKSAFEALINEKLYEKLLREIPRFVDSSEDSVRIYKIYGYGEVISYGKDVNIPKDELIII